MIVVIVEKEELPRVFTPTGNISKTLKKMFKEDVDLEELRVRYEECILESDCEEDLQEMLKLYNEDEDTTTKVYLYDFVNGDNERHLIYDY